MQKSKMENEAHVKREVKKILDKHEVFWWMPPANGFGRSGISDFNGVKHGIFFAIETKFGKNKPTPMQIGFLHSVRAENGYGFVVNEDRLGWLDGFLAAFKRAMESHLQGKEVSADDGAYMINAIREMTTELPPSM